MKPSHSKTPAATIDAYLAPLPRAQRDVLSHIRALILKAVPEADETISYGLPTFRLNGKVFFYFGAAATHCAIYAVPEKELQRELVGFETSGKGTVRFTPDHPLPDAVIAKIIALRLARIDRKGNSRKLGGGKRSPTKTRTAIERGPTKRRTTRP